MAFSDVAASNEVVRLWLPCNEGSGTSLTNKARDSSKATGTSTLHVNAWALYNASTRPAVNILQSITANALLYPFNPARKIYGNTDYPGDSVFTAALMRFSGSLTSSLLEIGATNHAHSFGKVTGSFVCTAGDGIFFTESLGTTDTFYGVACFAQAGGINHIRRQWVVIRYDSNFTEQLVRMGDDMSSPGASPGYSTPGGLDMGGTVDIQTAGGSWELYACMHAQVPFGWRLGFGRVDQLLEQARVVFTQWEAGTKDIPPEWYTAYSAGGVRRGRNRGAI